MNQWITKILKAIKIKAIAQSFIKVDNMQTAKGIEQKPYWEISMFPPSEFIYRWPQKFYSSLRLQVL